MRNFFLRLRAALVFSKVHPHIAHAPEWTPADSKALSAFLVTTPTGAKLRRTLWHHIQACAFRAVIERNHATFECGYASGARGLASVIDSLLKAPPEEPAEKAEISQQEDLDAHRP